jgi:hypothetical protein
VPWYFKVKCRPVPRDAGRAASGECGDGKYEGIRAGTTLERFCLGRPVSKFRKCVSVLLLPLVLFAQSRFSAHAAASPCPAQKNTIARHVHLDAVFGEFAHYLSGESPDHDSPHDPWSGESHDRHAVFLPDSDSRPAERSPALDVSSDADSSTPLTQHEDEGDSLLPFPRTPSQTKPVPFLTLRLLI